MEWNRRDDVVYRLLIGKKVIKEDEGIGRYGLDLKQGDSFNRFFLPIDSGDSRLSIFSKEFLSSPSPKTAATYNDV